MSKLDSSPVKEIPKTLRIWSCKNDSTNLETCQTGFLVPKNPSIGFMQTVLVQKKRKMATTVTTLGDEMRWDQLTTSDSPANHKTKSKLPKSVNYNYETPYNYLSSSARSLRYLYIGWFFTPPFELVQLKAKQIQSFGLDVSLAIADRTFCNRHLLRPLRCPATWTVILRSCRSHNQQGVQSRVGKLDNCLGF